MWGRGSSTFLRKELWFLVIISLIWGAGSLVKSNGFKVKDFGVHVLLLIRAVGPEANHLISWKPHFLIFETVLSRVRMKTEHA